ncbi:cyclodeaminase/cyclohydrolase family protein [Candidatus Omnitrophota bacterium]
MYKETLQRYLDDLASNLPAPGGGSAAALASATGISLLSMVANFTIGKEKYKSVEENVRRILEVSEQLRLRLLELVDEDAAGYKQVSQAYKLPKETAEEKKQRRGAIQQALKEALAVPLEVCKLSHQAAKLCPQLAEQGNPNLISDVGVAIVLVEAAFQSALLNVEINLNGLKDEKFILEVREITEPLEKEIAAIKDQVWQTVKQKMVEGAK